MKLPFVKMEGAGNDYIYVDGFKYFITNPSELSKRLSDRHFGIGADGLVIIQPSKVADCRMQMLNADGSEGEMCGNAIRCVGKWMYEFQSIRVQELSVETLSGIKILHLNTNNRTVDSVSVEMGKAQFRCVEVPIDFTEEYCINHPISIEGHDYSITAISMGNPHAVVFTHNIDNLPLQHIGPLFENHILFPERVNTEFIEIIDNRHINMRVWERGSGETLACGTGACAAVAAAVRNNLLEANTPIEVKLKGGILTVVIDSEWQAKLTGPANFVFNGEIETPGVITINN